MALYHNDGYTKITFRPSSTAEEIDTTRIKVRTYKSDYPDIYADARRFSVEFVPLAENGTTHGIAIEFSGSHAELESVFQRAIQAIRETANEAGDGAEYMDRKFEGPGEVARLDAIPERAHA